MTDLHRELEIMALTWLSNRVTHRGIISAIEVPFYRNVIDAGALCRLQLRFWESYHKCNFIQPFELLCLFEVKVSRSDFLKTFSVNGISYNPARWASFKWIVTTREVATISEIPHTWGLLVQRGKGLSEIVKPKYSTVPDSKIFEFAYALCWSQKHAGRNERIRKIRKSFHQ